MAVTGLTGRPGARKKVGDRRTQGQRAVAVCERVADGLSLRKAAQQEGLDHSRFLQMVSANKDLQVLYSEAKEAGIDARVEALREQADDVMKHAKSKGHDASSYVSAFATKARVVQWDAEKLAPKKYGAKLDLNHSGSIDLAGALNSARKRKDAAS